MNTQQVDDAKIYSFLSQVDTARVACWLSRLDRVVAAKKPDDPSITDKKWTGRKNAIKGKIFERLVGAILCGIKGFDTWKDVTTTTNQLDMLVHLGPTAQFSPALREWGTALHLRMQVRRQSDWRDLDREVEYGPSKPPCPSWGIRQPKRDCERGTRQEGPQSDQDPRSNRDAISVLSCLWIDPDLEKCIAGQNLAELLSRKYVGTKNRHRI